MRFSFPFFHFFIIEITFILIFSKSLLYDYLQESLDHQVSLIPVEEHKIAKKLWPWYFSEITTKSDIHPNETKK